MALLKFLKGNYSSLSSAAIAEGQILICGDTGEMFVDVAADKRVKIGDYVTVASLEALLAIDATSVPTSRLYYVEGANILARSNGTSWDQINKDTGATSIEVVGEGNILTRRMPRGIDQRRASLGGCGVEFLDFRAVGNYSSRVHLAHMEQHLVGVLLAE